MKNKITIGLVAILLVGLIFVSGCSSFSDGFKQGYESKMNESQTEQSNNVKVTTTIECEDGRIVDSVDDCLDDLFEDFDFDESPDYSGLPDGCLTLFNVNHVVNEYSSFSSLTITGEVKNDCGVLLELIDVNIITRDENGVILDSSTYVTKPWNLEPGKTGVFAIKGQDVPNDYELYASVGYSDKYFESERINRDV